MPSTPLHRLRWCPTVLLLGLALAALACGAATAPRQVTLVEEQSPAEPKLDFGTLSLRMPLGQLQSLTGEGGWRIEGEPAANSTLVLLPPEDDIARRYAVIIEDSRVVQLVVEFRQPDDARVELRHSYPLSKVQPDGEWAMTDAERRTLVVIAPHGARIIAIHLATIRDQVGVRAALGRYLAE